MSLLIQAGVVVTGTGEQIEGGWVRCLDGVIDHVGSGEPPAADEVLHLPNCVALPGLVNAHDHMYQWATRGYAPSGKLLYDSTWFSNYRATPKLIRVGPTKKAPKAKTTSTLTATTPQQQSPPTTTTAPASGGRT